MQEAVVPLEFLRTPEVGVNGSVFTQLELKTEPLSVGRTAYHAACVLPFLDVF